MAFNQNYYLTWENGELVTADTMSAFSDGVVSQVLALTDGILPVILSGGIVSLTPTVSVTEGYYRVVNQQSGGLEIPGYFYAPAVSNIKFNNKQYIVARINISTISQYTTVVSGNVIVVDTPTNQDVILYSVNYDGTSLTSISRDNDLQLLISTINKSNQLIVNNVALPSVNLSANNQQVLILAIAQNAEVKLPNITKGTITVINSSKSSIQLIASDGTNIFGKPQVLITPNSVIEAGLINSNWVFL